MAGGLIIYSFWLILATLSFWFVRVENILVIFQSMYEAGRWPVRLYPGWLRYGLTFIVPVAFATTIPAELGNPSRRGGTGRGHSAGLAGILAAGLAALHRNVGGRERLFVPGGDSILIGGRECRGTFMLSTGPRPWFRGVFQIRLVSVTVACVPSVVRIEVNRN